MQRGLLLSFVACCVRVLLFCSFVLGWVRWRGGVFDVFRRVDVWRVLRVGRGCWSVSTKIGPRNLRDRLPAFCRCRRSSRRWQTLFDDHG